MSLCPMEINGSLEKNFIVNDEITVSRPTNMPSTCYLKRYKSLTN